MSLATKVYEQAQNNQNVNNTQTEEKKENNDGVVDAEYEEK